MNSKTEVPRRAFIKLNATAAAGFTILPSYVISGLGHKAPGDKLNIAGIGVGGQGYTNLRNMETENIVALCDVDWEYAGNNSFKRWPMAKTYKDYRLMFEQQKDIDAVVIATPDHSHALPALMAIREKKHVFLQTPLTHSIYEARVLNDAAKRYGVATQMGNQGDSDDGIRRICEWIWAGVIGEVTNVDAWTTEPVWTKEPLLPAKNKRVPRDLDWDLFIGPAQWHDYHPDYHPWNWRMWWDFGTAALGGMGCHILNAPFKALLLKSPSEVEASSAPFNVHSPPKSTLIRFKFPVRDNLPKVGMPEVTINWYDGGLLPPRPDKLKDGEPMGDNKGGCIFYGTRGKIMCGTYGQNPTLLPTSGMEHFQEPQKSIRRISDAFKGGHEQDWIRACKEPAERRLPASSNFEEAGPLAETVLLGVLAIRTQSLNKKIIWDGPNMQITNIDFNDMLKILTKNEFTISNGIPKLNKEYASLVAHETVEEWIRHSYRQGWEQI